MKSKKKAKEKETGRPRKRRFILKAVTIVAAILSVMCFLARFISPDTCIIFHYIGLGAVGVVALDIALAVIWLVLLSKWIAVPVVCLLLNLSFITSMIHFSGNSDAREESPYDLRVCTYNICSFSMCREITPAASFIRSEKADVVCLQENGGTAKVEQLREQLGFQYSAIYGSLAIISRFPLSEIETHLIADSSREVLCADVTVGGRSARIITTHLQTTGVSAVRVRLSKEEYTSLQGAENSIGYNARMRAKQAVLLDELIEKQQKDFPLIVCGDFNDTPVSYTYHKIKGRLSDGFKACGHGFGSTFIGLKGIYRIDYIFYNRKLVGTRYDIPDVALSDHKAVMMNLKFD